MNVIIDGYNMIFGVPELGANIDKCDTETLRNKLLLLLERYKEKRRHELIVVFDGNVGASSTMSVSGIDVVFPRTGLDADEEIKNLVSRSRNPRHIIVVTGDRSIRQFVRKCGSKVVGPLEFYKSVQMKTDRFPASGRESKGKIRDGKEPVSKITGPSRTESQYWLKVFSELKEKPTDD
ncbi:MAG: NYN domain-containing protein [Candidatus Scalindua sp.]|nr:NYN domain-containing protein [Candidatus Scalindua sp.]